MNYLIDQSGKIEHTGDVTVVCLANGKTKTIQIGAGEKQKLIRAMRQLDYPKKTFIFKIFAALIFLVLEGEKVSKVSIDREYPNHEQDIKLFLIQHFRKSRKSVPEISFARVENTNNAHKIGLETFQKKRKPDVKVTQDEILGLIYGTKKRWRSRSGRDNPYGISVLGFACGPKSLVQIVSYERWLLRHPTADQIIL